LPLQHCAGFPACPGRTVETKLLILSTQSRVQVFQPKVVAKFFIELLYELPIFACFSSLKIGRLAHLIWPRYKTKYENIRIDTLYELPIFATSESIHCINYQFLLVSVHSKLEGLPI
jgi:hypothetical protein